MTAPAPALTMFPAGTPAWTVLLLVACIVTSGVVRLLYSRRRAPATSPHADPGATQSDRPVLIAFASQSGFAESIAWSTAESLHGSGVPVRLAELGALDAAQIAAAGRALFIVSTTGQGDPPDSARAFARNVIRRGADLRGLQYGLLALGDRSYEEYCGFGRRLDRWLRDAGATPAANCIEVDNADAGALRRWRRHLGSFGLSEASDWRARKYFRWRLAQRTRLNPGSPGGPVFHIVLTPIDAPPAWQAGDIAEVFPGPAEQAFARDADLPHREYTVASLPRDGALELIVRQMRRPDGQAGVGSGWLTLKAVLDQRIAVRVRENRAFHAPPDDRPMILIGNGTGIAGLRAHLKARAALGHRRNWLIFGERTAAHDWLFRDEIEVWRREGHIGRLDLAFSQDQAHKVYVQHRLAEAADEVRAWIDMGASIYVCGSLQGMAGAVTQALTAILGEERLDRLIEARRYCRDVY